MWAEEARASDEMVAAGDVRASDELVAAVEAAAKRIFAEIKGEGGKRRCAKTTACKVQGVLEASGTSVEFVLEHGDAILAVVDGLANAAALALPHVEGREAYKALTGAPYLQWLRTKLLQRAESSRKRKRGLKVRRMRNSQRGERVEREKKIQLPATCTRLTRCIWDHADQPTRAEAVPQVGVVPSMEVSAAVSLSGKVGPGERPPVVRHYDVVHHAHEVDCTRMNYHRGQSEGFSFDEYASPEEVMFYRTATVVPGGRSEGLHLTMGESYVKLHPSVLCAEERCSHADRRFWKVQQIFEVKAKRQDQDTQFALVRLFLHGASTVLGDAARADELFLTWHTTVVPLRWVASVECVDMHPSARKASNGHKERTEDLALFQAHKKAWDETVDAARPVSPYGRGHWPSRFYFRRTYDPENHGFFSIPEQLSPREVDGTVEECPGRAEKLRRVLAKAWFLTSSNTLTRGGQTYKVGDFVYCDPSAIATRLHHGRRRRKVTSQPFAICRIADILDRSGVFFLSVQRCYRASELVATPRERSRAATLGVREIHWCEDACIVPVAAVADTSQRPSISGSRRCKSADFVCRSTLVRKQKRAEWNVQKGLPAGALLQDPSADEQAEKEVEKSDKAEAVPLRMLDLFCGAGGLSLGVAQAGSARTEWAVERCPSAARAKGKNDGGARVIVADVNSFLAQSMHDADWGHDCVCDPRARTYYGTNCARPGEVELIVGGPPCKGFSLLNRSPSTTYSLAQNEMVLTTLSAAEYFRPKYFLMENVKAFSTHDGGRMFRMALRSLIEMNYQVTFKILQAGHYGCPQNRKRLFIWGGPPQGTMPKFPEATHAFSSHGLHLPVAAEDGLRSVPPPEHAGAAPLPPIAVRDAISDLPRIGSGRADDPVVMKYACEPKGPFQKAMRAPRDGTQGAGAEFVYDHRSLCLSSADSLRCSLISKTPAGDWHDLDRVPDGQVLVDADGARVRVKDGCLVWSKDRRVPLVPAHVRRSFKSRYGRLPLDGAFPTIVTNPTPSGTVSNYLLPDQDRVISLREAARAQTLPDWFRTCGTIRERYAQIGNAVPASLALALGRELTKVL